MLRHIKTYESFATPPSTLYHHTGAENRESIKRSGLVAKYDQAYDPDCDECSPCIYLIDTIDPDHTGDVWQVDVTDMPIEDDEMWDETGAEGASYMVCGQDIPSNRLKLIRQGR